jgi:hypothetical protein
MISGVIFPSISGNGDLAPVLYYLDIDLFVIRNPEGSSDVVVAVIDIRNLKGTELMR